MKQKIRLMIIVFMTLFLTACSFDGDSQEAGEAGDGQPEKLEGHDVYKWKGLERIGEEDPVFCNLPENNPGYLDSVLPVCMDPVYGILYFVNYGEDYCIYGKKDGKTEKIADIPGRRLFCRDGCLYFIADTYDRYTLEGLKNGNILQYDPAEGELSIVVDNQAISMAVYQDGIYYTKEESKELGGGYFIKEVEKYCYSFSDGSNQKLQETKEYYDCTFYRCGEDFIFYRTEPVSEEDMDEQERMLVELAGGGELTRNVEMKLGNLGLTKERSLGEFLLEQDTYLVIGKDFYYIKAQDGQRWLAVFDTESMTEKSYSLGEYGAGDLCILEDRVYFTDGTSLDMESGAMEYFHSVGDYFSNNMYTDGKEIYAICQDFEGEKRILGRQVIQDGSLYYEPMVE